MLHIEEEEKEPVSIHIGDKCSKNFLWGDISSDIRSEILFYDEA